MTITLAWPTKIACTRLRSLRNKMKVLDDKINDIEASADHFILVHARRVVALVAHILGYNTGV